MMGPYHRRSVPKDRYEGPCQRPRHDRDVYKARCGRVTEIERDKIEEVQDQEQLRNPEAGMNP